MKKIVTIGEVKIKNKDYSKRLTKRIAIEKIRHFVGVAKRFLKVDLIMVKKSLDVIEKELKKL